MLLLHWIWQKVEQKSSTNFVKIMLYSMRSLHTVFKTFPSFYIRWKRCTTKAVQSSFGTTLKPTRLLPKYLTELNLTILHRRKVNDFSLQLHTYLQCFSQFYWLWFSQDVRQYQRLSAILKTSNSLVHLSILFSMHFLRHYVNLWRDITMTIFFVLANAKITGYILFCLPGRRLWRKGTSGLSLRLPELRGA